MRLPIDANSNAASEASSNAASEVPNTHLFEKLPSLRLQSGPSFQRPPWIRLQQNEIPARPG
jgi:hypothetical protein